jgi:hypothetical protein
MPVLDTWEWILLAAGVFVAIVTLTRLMRHRRDGILDELRLQAESELRRRKSEGDKGKRRNPKRDVGERAA